MDKITDAERIEDLAAEIMSRGQMATPELLTSVRLSVVRMEGKLDNALAELKDVAVFQRDTLQKLADHDKRLMQNDTRWKVAFIVLGGLWAVLLLLLTAVAYPIMARAVEAILGA